MKTMEINGKLVKLQIWDTAGHERFKNITSSYYRGANGILLLYNITDRETFENLGPWLIEIEKNAPRNICKILVGTNCDLEEKRKVTTQEGKDFATSNGLKFIEVSAKNNINVKKSFEILVEDIINSYTVKKSSDLNENNNNNKKNNLDLDKKNKKCIIF